MTTIAPGSGTTLTSAVVGGNTVETITSGAVSQPFTFAGIYPAGAFVLGPDSASGVQITAGTPCYCRGTLILTDRGEVAAETLAIGDHVVTASGAVRPIKWIGRRSYGGRFTRGNRAVLPVVIRAGALADGVPRRDLFVSPMHAMFLDGLLIPARALINGTTVVQVAAVDQVEYIHIELETHDVILAEGAASETFVDDDSRAMFLNARDFALLYPDTAEVPAIYCAPRVRGRCTARTRLAARCEPACRIGGCRGRASPPGSQDLRTGNEAGPRHRVIHVRPALVWRAARPHPSLRRRGARWLRIVERSTLRPRRWTSRPAGKRRMPRGFHYATETDQRARPGPACARGTQSAG